MKKGVVLLFVLLFNLPISAQKNNVLDSLKNRLSKTSDIKTQTHILLKIAKKSNSFEALTYSKKALKLAKENNFQLEEALSYESIAFSQRKLGNFSEAVASSLNALKIYEKTGKDKSAAVLLSQLGAHFVADKSYEEAISYLKRGLVFFRKIESEFDIALTLINLGESYRLSNQLQEAKECFQEALSLNEGLNDKIIQGYTIGNLGMTYRQLEQNQEAKESLNEAIEILTKLGDLYSVSVYQFDLAKIYIKQKEFKKGEELFLASLEIAKKQKLKEQIRDFSLDIANYYEESADYKKALDYRKQYEIFNDSLVNIENVKSTERHHRQYLLGKKEQDIQLLEVKNKFQYRLVLTFAIGAALLLVLVLLLLYVQRQRKLAYIKVSEQKNIIEKRDAEKEVLLRELNHRVKNNMQMVASFLGLQTMQYKDDETIAGVLKAARHRIETLSLIHQKLYQGEVDGYVKLDDYIEELCENLISSFSDDVKLITDLQPLSLHIETTIPLGIVINELVTNALKYAIKDNNKPELTVSLLQKTGNVELVICDNGPGYHADLARTQSLGLKLVKSLIHQIRGDIRQENKKGCCWTISINLDNFKQLTPIAELNETH